MLSIAKTVETVKSTLTIVELEFYKPDAIRVFSCDSVTPPRSFKVDVTVHLMFTLNGVFHWLQVYWQPSRIEEYARRYAPDPPLRLRTRLDPTFDDWPPDDREALEQRIFDQYELWRQTQRDERDLVMA